MKFSPGARAALSLTLVIGLVLSGVIVLQNGRTDTTTGNGFSTFSSDQDLFAFLSSHGGNGNSLAAVDSMESMQKGATVHTSTNTQEDGIDELDTIETDGAFIYVASSDRVDIIEVTGNGGLRNASVIKDVLSGETDVNGYIQGIFVKGDRLAVIVSVQQYSIMPMLMAYDISYWGGTEVYVIVYDISEPSSPVRSGVRGVTGWYTDSRVIDGYLYLMTQQSAWDASTPAIPTMTVDGATNDIPSTSISYDPKDSEVQSYTNIMSVDLSSLRCNISSVLMGYGNILYASGNAIYVTCQAWETASYGDVVSNNGRVWTDIYRFDLNESSVGISAKGRVEGYLNDQFCMDEEGGYLRLTTCSIASPSESMVFVLDQELQVIGELRGLGANETIQAARFLGDTLYLVTFLRTDPLFIIDLSNPTHPSLTGELVVPGFSSYLHQVGDGRLVGIGVENGTLKLSLYNVSDPTMPVETGKVMAPTWAWSVALWDHHAFMFETSAGIIAIPVQLFTAYGGSDAGAYLVQVNGDALELLGLVRNQNDSGQSRCVMIGGLLYTITDTSVSAWDIGSLTEVGHLVYKAPSQTWNGSYIVDRAVLGAP